MNHKLICLVTAVRVTVVLLQIKRKKGFGEREAEVKSETALTCHLPEFAEHSSSDAKTSLTASLRRSHVQKKAM